MACPVNHPLFHALVFLLGVLVVLSRYVRADASTFASAQIKGVVGTPREFTVQELERYSGLDEELPVYLALQRRVYDVTSKREVYSRGGSYGLFAGKEGTRAFAKYSTELSDVTPCIDDLGPADMSMLAVWRDFFDSNYPVVGQVVGVECPPPKAKAGASKSSKSNSNSKSAAPSPPTAAVVVGRRHDEL